MKKRIIFLLLIIFLVTNMTSAGEKRLKVYAIAYIASAYYEVEELTIKNNWLVTEPEEAETVVAAVRTRKINPLGDTYSDYRQLEEDVKKYTEEEGSHHLIYFYKVEKDSSLTFEKYLFSRIED